MAKKQIAGQRKIKAVKHSPPLRSRSSGKEIALVVESPVDSHEQPLENILQNFKADLRFSNLIDVQKVRLNLGVYNTSEVYITEGTKIDGKLVFSHGYLETDIENEETYNITLTRQPNLPEVHYFSNLRRMIVVR
jgi:hypothetical protein